jgi:hypothetical protein
MYDLNHPSDRHTEEYHRLRGIMKTASDKVQRREATEMDEIHGKKAQQALDKFADEGKAQLAHISATHKRLEAEKSLWFSSGLYNHNQTHTFSPESRSRNLQEDPSSC